MAEVHFWVQVESGHLKRLSAARPIPTVAELIWIALDADATPVDLEVDDDEIAIRSVTIRDNGTGFPHGRVEELFGHVGGSWKAHGARSPHSRILHDKEAKGRLKALGLGRDVEFDRSYRSLGREQAVRTLSDETPDAF